MALCSAGYAFVAVVLIALLALEMSQALLDYISGAEFRD
jgi:hypothetical protein